MQMLQIAWVILRKRDSRIVYNYGCFRTKKEAIGLAVEEYF